MSIGSTYNEQEPCGALCVAHPYQGFRTIVTSVGPTRKQVQRRAAAYRTSQCEPVGSGHWPDKLDSGILCLSSDTLKMLTLQHERELTHRRTEEQVHAHIPPLCPSFLVFSQGFWFEKYRPQRYYLSQAQRNNVSPFPRGREPVKPEHFPFSGPELVSSARPSLGSLP